VQFFPLRRLIDLGLHPAGGVDTIGTQNFATSPFFSISRGVLRDTKYGTVTQADQAITVMEGIRMFTIWAAESGFMEDDRGSVEAGKLADLIVLDRNPLAIPATELEDIQIDLVLVDGKTVHQRP
jgi:predicted amidohydrolase YtcJ